MNGALVCEDCGCTVSRNGPMQRYCPSCSERRDLQRKRRWARPHPLNAARRRCRAAVARRRKERAREAGQAANQLVKRSVAWNPRGQPDLLWSVRIAVPFTYAVSKNHIYTMRAAGHVALRRAGRAARELLAAEMRAALAGRRVAHNKLWIDILVQKPDHRGDAVNVVDVVCDALKAAVPVDDRWFCIRCLDWEIAKADPCLFVGIGQDTECDCQVCSYCGQIKELSAFTRRRNSPLGVGRECNACRRRGRALARQQRDAEAGPSTGAPS
jgi:uncharacterized Zn finger protein (UPF0148 family)